MSTGSFLMLFGKLKSKPVAFASTLVVCLFLILAVAAPLIAPFDPSASSWSVIRKAPNSIHWFGTDEIGRDILSRIIWGARASLSAGFISVLISLAIGFPLGLIAGFVGGVLDTVISRVTDALLACPFLILAIALASFMGPSLMNAMISIGISASPIFIRLTRGQVIDVMAQDYIEAAVAIGSTPLKIAISHVVPNITTPIIVQASLTIAAAVIAEASLSFLGLGQQPPSPSWGSMLNTAKDYLETAPWMAVFPGACIFLLVVCFNLMGDGLREILDPKLN